MYREVQPSDYQQIADYSNQNNRSKSPLWCKTEDGWDSERISRFVSKVEEKGNVRTLVYEDNGKLLAYSIGFVYEKTLIFLAGVVDVNNLDPFYLWKRHFVENCDRAIKDGIENFYIRYSGPAPTLFDWQEKEIGMERIPDTFVWRADSETLGKYIQKFNEENK